MKIQRFNENINSESEITLDNIKLAKETRAKLNDFEDKIKDLLAQYILVNKNLIDDEEDDIEESSFVVDAYGLLPDGRLWIDYKPNRDYMEGESNETVLSKEDLEDFFRFTKNPEFYQNIKKFNL